MYAILPCDRATHPPVGSWAVMPDGRCYLVVDRRCRGSEYQLTVTTPMGYQKLSLQIVQGWYSQLPVGTAIISDTGWPATIIESDPSDGMYRVEGDCIMGWLYPDQFTLIAALERVAA